MFEGAKVGWKEVIDSAESVYDRTEDCTFTSLLVMNIPCHLSLGICIEMFFLETIESAKRTYFSYGCQKPRVPSGINLLRIVLKMKS